ncbi:uncharacterized protein LOC105888671 [Clupea harengus]|uniref:Uncharacterized protein LOC105888671 n=1 Tax=Clupea harengus TaxID=7950 RepID=A0A6P8EVG7_CLUHA|nr:uncharacterized protein LOC105888671 [Clupea harengus]
MHYVLVFGPSVLMFTAFVLWGVIEGFLGEVVICSTLNLIRFILLFKTSLYQEKLPEIIKTIIEKSFYYEYIIVVNVLFFVIFYSVWSVERESKAMALMFIMYGSSLHMTVKVFSGRGSGVMMEMMDFCYLFALSFLSRTFSQSAFIGLFVGIFGTPILVAIVLCTCSSLEESELFHLGFMALWRLIMSVVFFCFFDQILERNEERDGLLSVIALFQLLVASERLEFYSQPSLAETPKTILYMYGAFGVVAVNAITLATELMLKSRKGRRTLKDLRVIVLPFECVFVLSCIALWIHAVCTEASEGIKQEVAILRRYGCRRWWKFLKDGAKPSEALEMLSQSAPPPAGPDTPQESPPDPPPEAETEIDSIGNVPEDRHKFTWTSWKE